MSNPVKHSGTDCLILLNTHQHVDARMLKSSILAGDEDRRKNEGGIAPFSFQELALRRRREAQISGRAYGREAGEVFSCSLSFSLSLSLSLVGGEGRRRR